jgi:hypothetical protein
MRETVAQQAHLRQLARSVIEQAILDMASPNPVKAIDALAWFISDDFQFWSEMWNVPLADPYQMFVRLKRYTRRRVKDG